MIWRNKLDIDSEKFKYKITYTLLILNVSKNTHREKDWKEIY